MEEILNRIQQREEAAARRDRPMAYAFLISGGRIRASILVKFSKDISKDNCGWSWKERWIAVRPWEKRVELSPSVPKKIDSKQKISKTTNLAKMNIIVSVKPPVQRKGSHTCKKKFKPNYNEASFPRGKSLVSSS